MDQTIKFHKILNIKLFHIDELSLTEQRVSPEVTGRATTRHRQRQWLCRSNSSNESKILTASTS